MPKVAMDYSKTIIYHFVCKNELIKCSYVGSTTNFIKRKNQHKSACNNLENKLQLYQTIRENGNWDNWIMKPLEEFPCENKTQQMIREQYWIDQLKPKKKIEIEQYTCECGSICSIGAKLRHEQSKKHQSFILTLPELNDTELVSI